MWKKITINTTKNGIDIVAARLDMLGISQVEIDEGIDAVDGYLREAALYWDYADPEEICVQQTPRVHAYIADLPENQDLIASVYKSIEELSGMDLGIDVGSLAIESILLDEEDWANNWKQYYKPIEIGNRLIVCPSWEKLPDTNRIPLLMDPGMAFGTGTHSTTRLCLQLLEESVKEGDIIADIGCGSGILSIASLLLGAKKAIAVDIDPITEVIAHENAAQNGISDEYQVLIGDVLTDEAIREKVAAERYDVIIANIVASVIIPLTPFVATLMDQNTIFISSGIIESRLDEVLQALKECGLEPFCVRKDADWAAIAAKRAQ